MNTQFVASIIVSGVIKPIALLLLIAVLGWFVRKKSASLQHFVLSLGVISLFILSSLAIGWRMLGLLYFHPWLSCFKYQRHG